MSLQKFPTQSWHYQVWWRAIFSPPSSLNCNLLVWWVEAQCVFLSSININNIPWQAYFAASVSPHWIRQSCRRRVTIGHHDRSSYQFKYVFFTNWWESDDMGWLCCLHTIWLWWSDCSDLWWITSNVCGLSGELGLHRPTPKIGVINLITSETLHHPIETTGNW